MGAVVERRQELVLGRAVHAGQIKNGNEEDLAGSGLELSALFSRRVLYDAGNLGDKLAINEGIGLREIDAVSPGNVGDLRLLR